MNRAFFINLHLFPKQSRLVRLALLATDCSTISSRQPGPWLGRHARAKSRILVPHNPNIQGENYYRCLRLPTICRIVAFERNTKNKPGLTIPDNVSFQDHVRARGGDDELLTNCTLKKIRSEIKDGLDLHGACGSIVMMKNTTSNRMTNTNSCRALQKKSSIGDVVKGNGAYKYKDQIKPGNLHPDPSKHFACFQTLMNLHKWLQRRREGWFCLGSFPTSSCLMGFLLVWSKAGSFLEIEDRFNFATTFPCKSRKNPS